MGRMDGEVARSAATRNRAFAALSPHAPGAVQRAALARRDALQTRDPVSTFAEALRGGARGK
jgi:hypothetical protein